MIFFYAGIGFAMLTTVVALFETSTTINKKQFINKSITSDNEKILIQKQNDKIFIQMLDDMKGKSLGLGQEICQNIKSGITDPSNQNHYILTNYTNLNDYSLGIQSYSNHARIKNGCELVKNSHRVIIVPSPIQANTYNLFSCVISIEPKCSFEFY
tara:strand:- start:208 stop:675 length:468 start_codon:yes stop_codon:yes gene_type:complete